MSFQTSPGVNVTETDLTAGVQTPSTTDGAIAGAFVWGPVEQIKLIQSEDDLVKMFGKPDGNSASYFFTAANFLAYGNKLRVARVVQANVALNATSDYATLTGTVTIQANTANVVGTGTAFTSELRVGQKIRTNGNTFVVSSITNATHLIATTALSGSANITSNTVSALGIYVKNDDDYESNWAAGEAGVGSWAAKYPGALGDSLLVSICPSADAFSSALTGTITANTSSAVVTGSSTAFTTELTVGDVVTVGGESRQVESITNTTHMIVNTAFTTAQTSAAATREWEYADLFDAAPGTSDYAADRGGADDELHIVVVDEDGRWTGTPGQVLERFAFVSAASDAKKSNGESNYYKNAINRKSEYIRWMDHPSNGANWGSTAAGVTFTAIVTPLNTSLNGGLDGASLSAGDLNRGYDLFVNPDVSVALVLGGPATTTVANHIISNIAEVRKDCVAFFSPEQDDVVDNSGSEVDDIIAFRNTLTASSYAMLDSGWKWQYDKYNDVYRWVPLNGDVAGLCARTDKVADPWYSPAGLSRGTIKNTIKLAFNPRQAQRDDLYKASVNPVISEAGSGVVLWGDKTLLNRPSAFDRINVRRLFIVIEKTIAQASRSILFEMNDENTRAAFTNLVHPFLRDVQARRGIQEFKVICDATNNTADVIDRNEFRGDIYIKPNRSINFITLNFVATRTGVSFTELVSSATER